jgi:acetolactate synthase-1/2/3 large subunit
MVSCAEALIKGLTDVGVKTIFGMPGRWVLPLYEALASSNINHITVKHEQAAAHAADGYARVSGRIGVCLGTAGPGATNMVTGVATAFRDYSPLIVLTGQPPLKLEGREVIEEIDLVSIFKPVTKLSMFLRDGGSGYKALMEAYRVAMTPPMGPVHLSIPGDVQELPSTFGEPISLRVDVSPDEGDVLMVAELISKSAKPLLMAGEGVYWSNSINELIKVAEILNIPVVTSLKGRGVIPEDHHLSLGFTGIRGKGEANRALEECDLIIALGCRLSDLTLGSFKPNQKIICVDVCPRPIALRLNPICIRSDAKTFLKSLLQKLPVRNAKPWVSGGKTFSESSHTIQKIIWKISKLIPENSIYVLDIGQHTIWAITTLMVKGPRSLILPGNFSTMGFALPAAMGVKIAKPNETVVALMGDGGLLSCLGELSTIKQYEIPILIIVFNNRGYGLIAQIQEYLYGRRYSVDFLPLDFVKIAESVGIRGLKVKNENDLGFIPTIDEPLLLEVLVDPSERVPLKKLSYEE